MNFSKSKRVYVLLGVILVVAMGMALSQHFSLQSALKNSKAQEKKLKKFVGLAQEVYNHHMEIEAWKNVSGSSVHKDLSIGLLVKLGEKHGVKTQISSGTPGREVRKKAYFERTIKLKIKKAALEDIVKFMIEVEKVLNTKITNLNFTRDRDDKDVWKASLSVTQIVPKAV